MKKISSWILLAGLLLLGAITAQCAEILPSVAVSPNEFPDITYQTTGAVFPLDRHWKYIDSDNKEFANPDFDDSKWQTIEVGKPKNGGAWSWYRVAFELPKYLENQNLLFDLGRISVYDEVYINGELVGSYGNPPPNFVNGASDVWRKYPISASHFHPGKNVIAVRVFPGYKGRLYEGNYTLQALTGNSVRARLNLKTQGVDALRTLLTEAVHLNVFAPGEKLLIAPDVSQLFGAPVQGNLAVKIINDKNQVIAEDATPLELKAMEWSCTRFAFIAPIAAGNYQCVLSYNAGTKVLWKEAVPFRVQDPNPLNFAPRVDPALAAFENAALPVQISDSAMGHFGPRDSHVVNGKIELFDDLTQTDSRSGLAYSAQFMQSLGAPRLFLANTRKVPEGSVGKLHRAAGYNYDGMRDVWSYGFVRPNRAGAVTDLSIKSTSWAKRTYHYEYKGNDWMDFSVSAISPAWMATSNAQKIRVFEDIEKNGVGLPTYLAYQSQDGIKVVSAKKGIHGSDMMANWVLAWFNGGAGWDEFDTPYLFVLQKRPDLVQCYADTALFFSYADSAGTIQGMSLYGVTLQRPDQTVDWKNAIPADVAERCRYWSQVLVNAPDQVKRTAQVDYAQDQLTVKDEFTYLNIQDDWNTQGLKIAPISPMLALTAHAGNINIATSKTAKDLQMATLQGPLCAADNTDQIVFRINGILHYIREVRDVQIAKSTSIKDTQEELNQLVQKWLDTELKNHPWDSDIRSGKLEPGVQRLSYTGLILALPYLEPSLRADVEKEIRTETEKYFLYTGLPDVALKAKLSDRYKDVPVNSIITNPYTGLQLATTALSETNFGIDQVYFTALDTYMMWMYGDTFHRYDWLKENYSTLQKYFNMTRNSHDWDTSVSWDTFSGFRVGSGLQECGGIFSGMVGMARIAHQLGDKSTSDEAAYYAVMEAIGLQGQLSASEYLRERRPWLEANTKADDIEYVQKIRPQYYAEINAFAGLSQAIIGSHNSGDHPGSFIESPLPELMRLYQEVWPKFTDDLYDPKYDRITGVDRRADSRIYMDTFLYQITHYPQTIDQVFAVRKNLDNDLWYKVMDYRGYMDSKEKIGYRELW
jgi:hypothetical protein